MNKNKGITLVATVITIIILIILATVSINFTFGGRGLIKRASEAKNQTDISSEKEKIAFAATTESINKENTITKEGLQKELDKIEGGQKTEVLKNGKTSFIVTFKNTGRNYEISENGNIEGPIDIEEIKDEYAGDITKNGTLDGSESKPYKVNCIEDLVTLSNMSKTDTFEGKKILLDRNLNFDSELSYQNYKTTEYGDINEDGIISELLVELTTRKGFTPINQFYGEFEGNNKTIYNLYENRGEGVAGLFNEVYGTVQNLGMENVNLGGGEAIGTISGYALGNIINCHIKGNANFIINADVGVSVGGLIGKIPSIRGSKLNINKCYSDMNVTINKKCILGGIIGNIGITEASVEIEITQCYNIMDFKEPNSSIGGIIGMGGGTQHNVKVEECYHIGNLEGEYVGRYY